MTIAVDLGSDGGDLAVLPTRPGVFALEDGSSGTLALAKTANLRRMVAARLAAPAEGRTKSRRRVEYRSLVRRVRALTVGSDFEAEWAYLQLARRRLPAMCRSLADRRRAWFIHADAAAAFPTFARTSDPGARDGVFLGPYEDKRAAGHAIDLLRDGFDLCRYHHLLLEAPDADACAYKEMGRCPAPCDGTIDMDRYRVMIAAAIDFVADARHGATREAIEARMRAASERLDFEQAAACRRRLEALETFAKPPYRHARRLQDFRYLAVLPSERADHVRLVIIVGGAIVPWADMPASRRAEELEPTAREIVEQTQRADVPDLDEPAVQNLGLVSRFLFRPSPPGAGEIMALAEGLTGAQLAAAVSRLQGDDSDVSESIVETPVG